MRRIVLGVLSTAGSLFLLLSYPPSTDRWAGTPSPVAGAPASPAPGGGRTYLGEPVMTKRGPVQVRITVLHGRIVAAEAVRHPGRNGRDLAINARALPILDAAVVAHQGIGVDHVSGATVTSAGYLASLQSAIDRAHR